MEFFLYSLLLCFHTVFLAGNRSANACMHPPLSVPYSGLLHGAERHLAGEELGGADTAQSVRAGDLRDGGGAR